MSFDVIWDDPTVQSTVRCDISGQWTWDDFYQARQQIYRLMDDSQHGRVFLIAHFADARIKIPQGALKHLHRVVTHQHPKAGLTIVVGADRPMKTVFGGLKRAALLAGRKVNFTYVDSLKEARRLTHKEHQQRNLV
jgi:hypothetical protein